MENFKFSTLEYKRPDFAAFASFAEETKRRIESADSYGQVRDAMLAYDEAEKTFRRIPQSHMFVIHWTPQTNFMTRKTSISTIRFRQSCRRRWQSTRR